MSLLVVDADHPGRVGQVHVRGRLEVDGATGVRSDGRRREAHSQPRHVHRAGHRFGLARDVSDYLVHAAGGLLEAGCAHGSPRAVSQPRTGGEVVDLEPFTWVVPVAGVTVPLGHRAPPPPLIPSPPCFAVLRPPTPPGWGGWA